LQEGVTSNLDSYIIFFESFSVHCDFVFIRVAGYTLGTIYTIGSLFTNISSGRDVTTSLVQALNTDGGEEKASYLINAFY